MKRISVSSGKIVFEGVEAADGPEDIEVSPERILASASPSRVSELLQFGIFFELCQLNQRIGSVNLETKQGVGLQALVGQQAVSMLEISEKLGRLNDQLQQMLDQAQAASSGVGVDKMVKEAMATVVSAMGGLGNQPQTATVEQPMKKGNSAPSEG